MEAGQSQSSRQLHPLAGPRPLRPGYGRDPRHHRAFARRPRCFDDRNDRAAVKPDSHLHRAATHDFPCNLHSPGKRLEKCTRQYRSHRKTRKRLGGRPLLNSENHLKCKRWSALPFEGKQLNVAEEHFGAFRLEQDLSAHRKRLRPFVGQFPVHELLYVISLRHQFQ